MIVMIMMMRMITVFIMMYPGYNMMTGDAIQGSGYLQRCLGKGVWFMGRMQSQQVNLTTQLQFTNQNLLYHNC